MIIEHSNLKYELSISINILVGDGYLRLNIVKKFYKVALPIIKSKIKNLKNILLIPSGIDYYIFKNELKRTDKANEDLAIIDDFMNNLDDKLKKHV